MQACANSSSESGGSCLTGGPAVPFRSSTAALAQSLMFEMELTKRVSLDNRPSARDGHKCAENTALDPSYMPGSVVGLVDAVKQFDGVPPDLTTETPAKSLLSRAALAELAGVSRAAITKCCRTLLAPARVGTRVDLRHPAAVAYLARHGVTEAEQDAALQTQADRFPAGLTRFVRELRARVVEAEPSHRTQDPQEQALWEAARAFARWAELEQARPALPSSISTVAKPGLPSGHQPSVVGCRCDAGFSDSFPASQRDERSYSEGQA